MKQHKKVLKKPVLAIALAAILLVSVLTVSLVVSGKGRTAEDPISGNGRSENSSSESSMSAENVWKDNESTEGTAEKNMLEMAGNQILEDDAWMARMNVDEASWKMLAGEGGDNRISLMKEDMLLPDVTLQVGYLRGDCLDITLQAGEKISDAVARMEAAYQANPPADAPVVTARDWGIYTSRLAKEGLSSSQAAFYDRLDALCRRYIEDAALDGVKYEQYGCYTTDAVSYRDLGLAEEEAFDVLWWFKYNNPQYYFLEGWGLKTSEAIYPYLYDFAADGVERVKITNELFDKLDGWVESVNDDEITSWQKELSANNLLCKKIAYNKEYMGNFRIDQSLYSAVVMESTVCAGYAEAFCAVMNASGLDTVVALSPVHAWNVVCFDDGQYYAVDVTWNDNASNEDAPYNRYLNVGEVSLKAKDEEMEHTYCAEYMTWIPEISQGDYAPTDYDKTGSAQDENKIVLHAPENLQAVPYEDGTIAIVGDVVEKATGYVFEIYSGPENHLLASAVYGFPFMTVEYGGYTSLAVRVRAETVLDGVVYQSDWSEMLSVATNAGTEPDTGSLEAEKPDTPENVEITESTETTIDFSWDKVEGAEQYQVVLFKDAEYTQTWVSSYVTNPAAGFIKLQPDTMYYYGIRAMRIVDGEEHYSDWNYFSQKTSGQ